MNLFSSRVKSSRGVGEGGGQKKFLTVNAVKLNTKTNFAVKVQRKKILLAEKKLALAREINGCWEVVSITTLSTVQTFK